MYQRQKKSRRQEKIKRILETFEGINHISNIKSAKKTILTPKIKNEKREVITLRRGIANGFGEFHSKLHVDDQCDNEEQDADKREMRTGVRNKVDGEGEVKEIPEFTEKEVQAAIDSLPNKGKAGVIKTCDDETKGMIRQSFNEVLRKEDCTPEKWRRLRIKSYLQKK